VLADQQTQAITGFLFREKKSLNSDLKLADQQHPSNHRFLFREKKKKLEFRFETC
jgi:hypothetical protein